MATQQTPKNTGEVALIIGGGPGISASCSRLFSAAGMTVAVAARNPDKPVMQELAQQCGCINYACDASNPSQVADLFSQVAREHGTPQLVVHNIDGRNPKVFRRPINEIEPELVLSTLHGSAFSAFLVGQQAAQQMLNKELDERGMRGTIIFTNASAAFKGYAQSGAFAMASHGKSGLAQSMARELGPQGIHVAHVPIDAAIGWTQDDGSRMHRLAGTSVDDNLADPDRIADVYLQLHNQHRSTWAYEIVLRPWVENW